MFDSVSTVALFRTYCRRVRKLALVTVAIGLQTGLPACYAQLANPSPQPNPGANQTSPPAGNAQSGSHDGHDHSGHNHEQKKDDFSDYAAETEKFKQALGALRGQIKVIRAAQVRYHTCDSKEEEKRYRREFFEALDPMPQIQSNVLEAALEEFKTDPAGKVKLGHILFKTLKRNTDKDNFDGMLPIAKTLVEMGYPSADLSQIYLQSCLAAGDFQQAKSVIQASEKNIVNSAAMLSVLDRLEKEWAEELEAQKRDAAGEPLPQVKIRTTKGPLVVELFENDAPEAVANFISLAESGYFDSLDFFYVGDHQVAQTGCPNEDGTGGPGYMILNENSKPNARKLFRGSLALALLPGRPDSGGSVFFIPYLPALELDSNNYTVFGRVVSGMPSLANLNRVKPARKEESEEDKKNKPKTEPDEIVSVEVIRKRDHKYEPKKLPAR